MGSDDLAEVVVTGHLDGSPGTVTYPTSLFSSFPDLPSGFFSDMGFGGVAAGWNGGLRFFRNNAVVTAGGEIIGPVVVGAALKGLAARGAVAYVDEAVSGTFGTSSVGAGQVTRVLQTGGQTLLKRTANALNDALGKDLAPREWGRALEDLKQDFSLPGNHHGRILSDGSYLDEFGNTLGNLTDYLP